MSEYTNNEFEDDATYIAPQPPANEWQLPGQQNPAATQPNPFLAEQNPAGAAPQQGNYPPPYSSAPHQQNGGQQQYQTQQFATHSTQGYQQTSQFTSEQHYGQGHPGANAGFANGASPLGAQDAWTGSQQVVPRAGSDVWASPAPAYAQGQPGKIRSNGMCILLFIVTFSLYGFVWTYGVHKEMKRYSGQGIGGPLAVLLMFVPFAMWFLTPDEVGKLYSRRGEEPRVRATTGFWNFLPVAGAIIAWVRTNDALNDYWASIGVTKA